MDTIIELNPQPSRLYFQGDGKSENVTLVSLVQDSSYHLKLLAEDVRDRNIESACYSGMWATTVARVLARESIGKVKVLKDRVAVWQEKET